MLRYQDKLDIFNSLSKLERIMLCDNNYEDKDDSMIIYSKCIKDKGFIDINKYPEFTYSYIVITVNPKYRKIGLARHLLQTALSYCKKQKISKVNYLVDKDNTASRNLIRSFNYNYIKDRDYYEEYCFEFK